MGDLGGWAGTDDRVQTCFPCSARPIAAGAPYSLDGVRDVDCRGRIADRTIIGALGWRPGVITIEADSEGLFA